MASYASVSDFKRAIDTGVSDTIDDVYIQALLDAATAMIDAMTGRHFSAVSATRRYDVRRSPRGSVD